MASGLLSTVSPGSTTVDTGPARQVWNLVDNAGIDRASIPAPSEWVRQLTPMSRTWRGPGVGHHFQRRPQGGPGHLGIRKDVRTARSICSVDRRTSFLLARRQS